MTCTEVTVDSDAPELPVGVDGEALVLATPVHCVVRPAALRVRVPRARPGVPGNRHRPAWTDVARLAMSTSRSTRVIEWGGDHVTEGAGDPPVVIAHLSDLHFGRHDSAATEALLDDVAATRPGVTVVTGDLTQRARQHEFAAAVEFLERLPAPRLVVLGNHDVPLDSPQRVTAPYRKYRDHLGLDLDPVVDAERVRVLGLQSMPRWRWKSGRVSRRQTDSVGSRLGRAGDPGSSAPVVRVLALHHPVSPTGAATLVGRGRLLTALGDARVELVLAGHTHRPSLTWLELPDVPGSWAVLQGVAGTATSTRLRGIPRSWTLYRIDATTITVEQRSESEGTWATAGVWHLRRRSAPASAGRGGRDDRPDLRLPRPGPPPGGHQLPSRADGPGQ